MLVGISSYFSITAKTGNSTIQEGYKMTKPKRKLHKEIINTNRPETRQLHVIITNIPRKISKFALVQFQSTKMSQLSIVFTILLLLFHPTNPQIRSYFKLKRIFCDFSTEFYLENATCRAIPVDRDTVLISLYAMYRKTLKDDLSVKKFPKLLIDFSRVLHKSRFALPPCAKTPQHTSQVS
jgi:hypothetical protein